MLWLEIVHFFARSNDLQCYFMAYEACVLVFAISLNDIEYSLTFILLLAIFLYKQKNIWGIISALWVSLCEAFSGVPIAIW